MKKNDVKISGRQERGVIVNEVTLSIFFNGYLIFFHFLTQDKVQVNIMIYGYLCRKH